jgi:hypothetical protein
VLNGIGGRTIHEAKRRMTYAEAVQWVKYMHKRGTINAGMRVEASLAVLSTQVNRALGGKAEFSDFAPHWEKPAPKLDDVAKLFGAIRR